MVVGDWSEYEIVATLAVILCDSTKCSINPSRTNVSKQRSMSGRKKVIQLGEDGLAVERFGLAITLIRQVPFRLHCDRRTQKVSNATSPR